MRKLSLNPDDLQVESFATATDETPNQGTVRGHAATDFLECGGLGSRDVSICVCDTTHTQRAPECDPSAETFCIGTACDLGF